MVINKRIAVDLSNRFPASFIVMSHEMNVQSFNVVLSLYNEGEAVEFESGTTATATLVSAGYLICTDRTCNISGNEITVDITNDIGHTSNIPAGEMQVEICIKNGNTKFYIPYFSVFIAKAIQDGAAVTPESYGTVAAVVAEVAAARGAFATLTAALANKLDDADDVIFARHINASAVTNSKIAPFAVTMDKIANGSIEETKLSSELKAILPKITVWDYSTSQINNFEVPPSFAGKVGDIVIVSTGTGTGGLIYQCTRIISAYGSTAYIWENVNRKINATKNAVISDFIADGAVDFEKLNNGMVDKSSDSDTSYTNASDTHIPTTGFVKIINEETRKLISKIPKFSIEVVNELPTENISPTTVYLVRSNDSSRNIYTEYIFVDSEERTDWEKLGEQDVDLTDYIKVDDYATTNKAGIVQGDNKVVFDEGKIRCETMDLSEIENGNQSNFISAGSLKVFHENNKYDDTELKNEIAQVNENIDSLFVKKELLVNLSSFKDESGEYKNVGRYYYNSADKTVGISNDTNYACIPVELKAGTYSVQNINPYYSFYVLNNQVVRFGSADNAFVSTTFELPIDTTVYVSVRVTASTAAHETVAIASGDTIPDDISTLGIFSYDTSMELASVKRLEEKIPSVLTVKKDGTGDFSTLKEAVEYSQTKSDLTIEVYEGTYDLIEEFGEEYFTNLSGTSQRRGLQIGNGVHLIFSSGSKVVCHYQGDNETVKTCFSPFNYIQGTKGFTLENLTLEASNVRYAIHDEAGSSTLNMYRNTYKNCKITIDNSNNEVWKKHQCIGGGLGLHGEIIIENCSFTDMYNVGSRVSTVSYHNAVSEGAKSRIIVTGCYFSDNATFGLLYYGNSTEITEAYVSNCSMTYEPYITATSSAYTTENVKLIMWNNEIKA